jgi:hypothetical protein
MPVVLSYLIIQVDQLVASLYKKGTNISQMTISSLPVPYPINIPLCSPYFLPDICDVDTKTGSPDAHAVQYAVLSFEGI